MQAVWKRREGRSACRQRWLSLPFFCLLLLTSSGLLSCTNTPSGGESAPAVHSTRTVEPPQLGLQDLSWCSEPLAVFRDKGASATPTSGSQGTPFTTSDWQQVKGNLGFTVYLPETLSRGSCLMSVYGTFHDPIFGSSFTIAYLLPDHTSISLSEAPLHGQQQAFQCSVSANGRADDRISATATVQNTLPLQLCSGARAGTNVVLSAQRPSEVLQKFFLQLKENVEWLP